MKLTRRDLFRAVAASVVAKPALTMVRDEATGFGPARGQLLIYDNGLWIYNISTDQWERASYSERQDAGSWEPASRRSFYE